MAQHILHLRKTQVVFKYHAKTFFSAVSNSASESDDLTVVTFWICNEKLSTVYDGRNQSEIQFRKNVKLDRYKPDYLGAKSEFILSGRQFLFGTRLKNYLSLWKRKFTVVCWRFGSGEIDWHWSKKCVTWLLAVPYFRSFWPPLVLYEGWPMLYW